MGGLEWDPATSDYIADRAICFPPPDIPYLSAELLVVNWSLGYNVQCPENMGHHTYLCRRVKRNFPADETFQVTVKVKQGGNVVYEKTYYLAVKVVGGPLKIEVVFLADNEENTLKLHRSTGGSVNFEFPWYCYDFGYNPFL